MLEKIYFTVWALSALALGLFYMTGNLTPFTTVVFGFIFFGLTFMGMIGVLPIHYTHHTHHPKH